MHAKTPLNEPLMVWSPAEGPTSRVHSTDIKKAHSITVFPTMRTTQKVSKTPTHRSPHKKTPAAGTTHRGLTMMMQARDPPPPPPPSINTSQVDSMLATSLQKLSVQDRSKIEEEIHGVRSLAVVETPEMVEEALAAFQREVDGLPISQKGAYEDAMVMDSKFVQDRDFHRKFLRAALFDPRRAATIFCQYLDLLLEYFGPQALERPLRYDDLSKAEQDKYRVGNIQVLPSRDRAGRLVCLNLGSMVDVELSIRVG
jgi:hypothetical protein